MNRLVCVLLLFIAIPASVFSQKKYKQLVRQLNEQIRLFNGEAGLYVYDMETNKKIEINADTIFPTASTIKVPILIGVMQKIKDKQLNYHQEIVYKDSLLYAGVDILGSFKNNEKIELSKVIMLMLTTSDNTASLWLQSLAGKGDTINMIMDKYGFVNTRVNSRTTGREQYRSVYGWGQTTPREMGTIFEKLYAQLLIDSASSNKMIKLLGRNYWDEEGLSVIPAGVFVASKNGAVNASRSEVMMIYPSIKRKPLIISFYTKNNKDQSWGENNEAWVLTRKLVKLVYSYFIKPSQ